MSCILFRSCLGIFPAAKQGLRGGEADAAGQHVAGDVGTAELMQFRAAGIPTGYSTITAQTLARPEHLPPILPKRRDWLVAK